MSIIYHTHFINEEVETTRNEVTRVDLTPEFRLFHHCDGSIFSLGWYKIGKSSFQLERGAMRKAFIG